MKVACTVWLGAKGVKASDLSRLSYTKSYNKTHFVHDTYVYGYNEDFFCVMAYKGKKLQMFEVLMEEVVEAMYGYMKVKEDTNFCTFRPYHAIQVELNWDIISKEFIKYVDKREIKGEEKVYGINVYSILRKCIYNISRSNNNFLREDNVLDLRPFRMLWEHKKVLLEHLKKMDEIKKISTIYFFKMQEIEKITNRVFMMAIKYNITFENKILNSILQYLEHIENDENIFFDTFIETYLKK